MVSVINGSTTKPVATARLLDFFNVHSEYDGVLYTGYPVIGCPTGPLSIDAIWISKARGVIVFCLEEGRTVASSSLSESQEECYAQICAKLMRSRALLRKRKLCVEVSVVTFMPARANVSEFSTEECDVCNVDSLKEWIDGIEAPIDEIIYTNVLAIIQSVSSIRKGVKKRTVEIENSRGWRLKELEDSIANLDNKQGQAVIESFEGVQRIRGLAGSGKTVVLALKAAYLYAKHPDWRIAVTFHTRSLKGQFKRFINAFVLELTGEEPDWRDLEIIHAWGSAGGGQNEGLYHKFCLEHECVWRDFKSAEMLFGQGNEFNGACSEALSCAKKHIDLYDAILVDEAQDFPPAFLRLCYEMLAEPKRLVYAYDELQNLGFSALSSPEEIFGATKDGTPLVTLADSKQDIILKVCYRNSGPVLTTAHALGFGIYRIPPQGGTTGLVQMFDNAQLWREVGYDVERGAFSGGEDVILYRSSESSPDFLARHSDANDLIMFEVFESKEAQDAWVVEQIKKNIKEDELMPDDIIVINPNPFTTRVNVGPIREKLFGLMIPTHICGVDTTPDVFFDDNNRSIAFTGIFRAKGNEAGMVYVVNSEDCYGGAYGSNALLRNRLFTAITRSKAWVRVLGVGENMRRLKAEFEQVKQNGFKLKFRYPTQDELKQIKIVNRDMTKDEEIEIAFRRDQALQLVKGLKDGKIQKEDLGAEMLEELRKIFAMD